MNTREKCLSFIQSVADELGLAPSSVAIRAGVAPSTLNRFISTPTMRSLSATTLDKIASAAGYGSYESYIKSKDTVSIPGVSDSASRQWKAKPQTFAAFDKDLMALCAMSIEAAAKAEGRQLALAQAMAYTVKLYEHIIEYRKRSQGLEPNEAMASLILAQDVA